MAERTLTALAEDLRKASSPEGVQRDLRKLITAMAKQGQSFAQRNYGRNGLRAPTGNLKRSIVGRALTGSEGIGISLHAGDRRQVVYAAIHEFGGTITAKNGPYLHFTGRKGWARVQQVTIPPRPYIRPAIDNLRKILPKDISKVVRASVLGQRWTK